MSLILKEGRTFKNPYNGNITTAYARVKATHRDTDKRLQSIHVDIFVSKHACDNKCLPIEKRDYVCALEDFDTYFAESVIKQSNVSVESQAYLYLMQLEDENNEGVLVYEDWESDE